MGQNWAFDGVEFDDNIRVMHVRKLPVASLLFWLTSPNDEHVLVH